MSTETHIAGLDITWDGRYMRQRCAWSGAILINYDLTLVMVPDSDSRLPSAWPAGALVRRDGHMATVVPDEPSETGDGLKAPDDCCMRLDPAATV